MVKCRFSKPDNFFFSDVIAQYDKISLIVQACAIKHFNTSLRFNTSFTKQTDTKNWPIEQF